MPTAYSITSAYTSNGVCVTTSGSRIQLSSAYSQTLTSANGQVTLDVNGQQSFIDHLGFSTCSGGGENAVLTALVQVLNTTVTTTSSFTNVPLAAAVASLTIAPVSVLVCGLISCLECASLLGGFLFLNFEKETISADYCLSSNRSPLQHQEPLRSPHRPRSSPLLVVSNIFTLKFSHPSLSSSPKSSICYIVLLEYFQGM